MMKPLHALFACALLLLLSPGCRPANAQTSVYFSRAPLDFGVDNDKDHFVCTLPVAAPELFQVKDQWFLAALLPNLTGIQISHLT